MKKTVIALAVSSLAVVAVAQAAPQENTFYLGSKAGQASFHDGLNQFDAKYHNGGEYGKNRNTVTYGVFGGYQITNNFAVELGYDYFGRARGNENAIPKKVTGIKHTAHGTHLSLKASYPVLENLDVYARTGVALIRSDYYERDTSAPQGKKKAHRLQTSPVFAAGVEYALLPELALRAEYQWVNNVGNAAKAARNSDYDYRPDIGSINLGISYRFGQGVAPVEVVAPEVVTKNFSFSSDVLFDFNKSSLKASAGKELDNASVEIAKLGLVSPSIEVSGYTDHIGSDAYNQKLSQKRAETVANYLVSKGVDKTNLTAVGYGKANPKTGQTCDAVKGRKQLIACLAPDRRVEISVQGSKEVSM